MRESSPASENTTMSHDFTGKSALVTGGNSGIGRATALALATAGATVVIAARRREQGERTVEEIESAGGRALFVVTDVCDEEDVRRLVEQVEDRLGGLHLVFNNAGVGGDLQPLDTAAVSTWDTVMATNVRSMFVGLKHQVPALLRSGGGAVVNMSSVYGLAGKAAHHAYVASKHAVVGLTRSVAIELAGRGVRVNALCPGATETAAMRDAAQSYPDVVRGLVEAHPMGRMATESEVAAAVLWLCSDQASFVTVHALAVDGGFLAA